VRAEAVRPLAVEEPLSIDELKGDRRIVLTVAGEVDLASVHELKAALSHAEDCQPRDVWIDLSEVEFMDSTGLAALVLAHRHLDDPVRRLAVICPEGPVRRVLAIAGIDRVMPVHPSRGDALALAYSAKTPTSSAAPSTVQVT
jgi:anti-sigma B factor antagonist